MFLLVGLILVFCPEMASVGAREGLKMAFDVVVVSILPFSICASAIVYSGLARLLGAVLSPFFTKVLGLNPYGAVALLSGMLGGYPTGGRVVCDMVKEGIITKEQGEKILSYANAGGVAFGINVMGKSGFSSYKTGIIIYIIHIAAVLISALILNKREDYSIDIGKELLIYRQEKKPLMAVLGKSIASGGAVVMNIVSAFVIFYALIYALGLKNIPILCGIVEMTTGVIHAGKINNLPLASFFFTLGGLSVFAQTECICENTGMKMKSFYKGKLLSAAIAYCLSLIYTFLK